MKYGMLWFDNSDKVLEEKLRVASEYYEKKYGERPNTCHVNAKETADMNGVRIVSDPTILPNHIWIGVK